MNIMTRLTIIAALSFAFAVLLCYGAMRTAQAIAQTEARQQPTIY